MLGIAAIDFVNRAFEVAEPLRDRPELDIDQRLACIKLGDTNRPFTFKDGLGLRNHRVDG